MTFRFSLAFTLVMACTSVAGCATSAGSTPAPRPGTASGAASSATPPAMMIGNFDDDYGGSFSISSTDFVQLPRGRFHIVQWNVAQQYFIAQNDSLNRSDPGKWTRVDWLPLSGMEPYAWAFCFSAFKASTRAEAEAATMAKRDTPRTGCAGFPFTRMKRKA